MNLMFRKGFSPIIIVFAVVAVLAIGGFLYRKYHPNTSRQSASITQPALQQVAVVVATTTTMTTTSTPATTTFSYPSALLAGPFNNATATMVFAVVESSTAPLTSLLTDPQLQTALSVDSFVLIKLLAPVVWTRYPASYLAGNSMDVVGSVVYLNGFNLVPGEVVVLGLQSCALYPGWPNFTCVSQVSPLQHSKGVFLGAVPPWTGQNGASIALADASLDTLSSVTSSILSVSLDIASGYGEFCPISLINYGLGIVRDEYGDVIRPLSAISTSTASCIGPNATTSQEFFWNALPTSTPIIVEGLDAGGNQQTFFSLYPLPNQTMYIESAP